jgi:type IV pilus assembly protein PilN
MIKINLLAGGRAAGVEMVADEQVLKKQAITKLLVIFIPAVGLYLYESHNIPELLGEKARLQSSLSEMQAYNTKREESVKEIKKFKEDEARIQQRISALEKLQKDRANEVKLLKLFADVIPEKAWLTSVDMRGGKARLVGLALTNNDVSTLAERLKSNILVAELQLNDIREDKVEGVSVVKFDFTCLMEAKK